MRRASSSDAILRLEDARRLAEQSAESGEELAWLDEQEVALRRGDGVCLGLVVNEAWLAVLGQVGCRWFDKDCVLRHGAETKLGERVLKIITRADEVALEWPDAREKVVEAAVSQIGVLAFG